MSPLVNQDPFEKVEESERRFTLLHEVPPQEFAHGLTKEQLNGVDEVTRERWIMTAVMARKIDWLISTVINVNNNLYHLETEIIRGKKFRQYIWTRIVIFGSVGMVAMQVIWYLVKNFFTK